MKLIILGAGGHGKVVADIASQLKKYETISFLDDNSNDKNVLGKCDKYLKFNSPNTEMYVAIGNNEMRIKWIDELTKNGIKIAKIIHPMSYISPKAIISDGCVIMPQAIVNTGTKLEKGCIVNCGAIIDHDCIIEKGCHLAPGAIVKGENHVPPFTKIDSGEVLPARFYK